ncbi:uncharacterized protein MONBRDRAFT_29551 [Monosiga brevicollis MX1]|uniref:Exonuclease 1 n=1 Tax=Monosiga brevicollis TaxID=81824 RepID=A9VBF1_MONBE|nr:uncharacterized protein MONBRDRAFT_29551 [Monosiga brevicollis MX1]EDQ85176.1 predicted protein [Monosiga brevicollis MX1]|eukprot:XP_001750001.1 hypothetical protein [Monosiga brevicollis MX1]
MGIQGLLPLVQPAMRKVHMRAFEGKRVAIDAFSWLHRGAYACAMDLALRKQTDMHVRFCMKRIALLKQCNITPIMVFDGQPLPSKRNENQRRTAQRLEGRKRGLALLREGKRAEARRQFSQSIHIDGAIAFQLIEACRKAAIEVLVAPYEADAQMAFLAHSGYVDAVLTEDSDLIVYQVPCIIYKLEESGEAQLMEVNLLYRGAQLDSNINFASWTPTMFRWMCILAGCDYLPSAARMGIKSAYRIVRTSRSIAQICKTMSAQGFAGDAEYMRGFVKAENTFLHQVVFDPQTQQLRYLTAWPEGSDGSQHNYVGELFENELARAIACGALDPMTHRPHQSHAERSAATASAKRSANQAHHNDRSQLADADAGAGNGSTAGLHPSAAAVAALPVPQVADKASARDYLRQFEHGTAQSRTLDAFVVTRSSRAVIASSAPRAGSPVPRSSGHAPSGLSSTPPTSPTKRRTLPALRKAVSQDGQTKTSADASAYLHLQASASVTRGFKQPQSALLRTKQESTSVPSLPARPVKR